MTPTPDPDCPFCQIVRGLAPAQMVEVWPDACAFVPLNPVTEGHVLVVPYAHVLSAVSDPLVTAAAFGRAAAFIRYQEHEAGVDAVNLITSCGAAATQTIRHLHIHVVPRRPGDGLALPWSPQRDRLRDADLLIPPTPGR